MNSENTAPGAVNQDANLIEAVIPLIEAKNFFLQSAGYLLNWGLINSAIWGSFILKDGKKILEKISDLGFPQYAMIIVGLGLALTMVGSGLIGYRLKAAAVTLAWVMFIATAAWDLTFSICANRWVRTYSISVPQYWIWLIALAGALQFIWGASLLISRNRFQSTKFTDSSEFEDKIKALIDAPDNLERGMFTYAVAVPGKRVHIYKAFLLPDRMLSVREDLGKFIIVERGLPGQWKYLGKDLGLRQVSGEREYAIHAVDNEGKFVDILVDGKSLEALRRWTEIT